MTQDQIAQLNNYDVQINFLDYGCVVHVGCKSFAFESIEKAMAELTAYTKDPRHRSLLDSVNPAKK
jgi:hypothetical protein